MNTDFSLKAAFLHRLNLHIPTIKIGIYVWNPEAKRGQTDLETIFKTKNLIIEKRNAVENSCIAQQNYNIILYDAKIPDEIYQCCCIGINKMNQPVLEIRYNY